ncbi:hypothetical protein [Micromonospora chersina]|uniref:Uncharacterized protein n=1 Tax=Micromonospora chersina TaxID=47854 RepID=A0A1C6U2C9_9ACTN|nr:hypothetical protein [Micromonospora chersina]SCL48220.1 hypothetical protein GA0070603_0538 [Micromonospora chersina]
MSLHYEVVFSCFLDDETPPDVLDVLRWHLGMRDERPATLDAEDHPYRLLAPDPDSYLPGGDVASLRRQRVGFTATGERFQWGLHSRNYWLDDDLGELVSILDLIAPHVVEDGYGGHLREEYDTDLVVFEFRDGSYVGNRAH